MATTLYKPGSTASVSDALVDEYIAKGWSTEPVTSEPEPFDIEPLFEDVAVDTPTDDKPEQETDVEGTLALFSRKRKRT